MTHRVNHVELEVLVGAQPLGEQLLDRLSLLRERRIAPLIDRVCSELSGPERFDRIERIELDLGSVGLADFDEDFMRKLEAALRRALAKAVPARVDAQARVQAALELLEIFAWTGNLPWWADASSSDPVRVQIELLIGEAPRAFVERLAELSNDKAALARVLRHVDARALARLLPGEMDPSIGARLGEALERTLEAESSASEEPYGEQASLAKLRASERAETFETLLRELTRAHRLERADAEPDASVSVAVDDAQEMLRDRVNRLPLGERLQALLRDLIAVGRAALATDHSREELRSSLQVEHEQEPERSEGLTPNRPKGARAAGWTRSGRVRIEIDPQQVARRGARTFSEQCLASERGETFEALLCELAEDQKLHAWVVGELERASMQRDDEDRESRSSTEAPRETVSMLVLLRELAEQPQLAARTQALLQALLEAGRAALESGGSSETPRSSMRVEHSHAIDHASTQQLAVERSETSDALLRELAHEPGLARRLHALLQIVVAAGGATFEIGRSSEELRSSMQLERSLETEPERDAELAQRASPEEHPAQQRTETPLEVLLRELADDRRLHAWIVRELERASMEHDHEQSEPSTSSEQSPDMTSLHALLLHRIVAANRVDAAGQVNADALGEHPAQTPPLEPDPRQHAPAEPTVSAPARGRSSSNPRTTDRPAPARAARRRAIERLEELYVENAGLVLLWPFLARFFARVGLLDDKQRFVDEPARMQAVALLDLVAREHLDPPEFRLPLAKLLCGLAPIDEYELERPLAPEQIDECEHLLVAVIGNAPILRAMSVPSFRASFLQRGAVLCTRDGQWLLQVERADYDVVLERFPWSWDWLKLPWMPDALRVEW